MKAKIVLKSFPGHKGILGHQGGSLPENAANKGNESNNLAGNAAKTVTFYQAVNQEFPHEHLAALVDAISTGHQRDWFRGGGVLRIAATEYATSKRGFFNEDKYNYAMKRINELAVLHNFDIGLLQN